MSGIWRVLLCCAAFVGVGVGVAQAQLGQKPSGYHYREGTAKPAVATGDTGAVTGNTDAAAGQSLRRMAPVPKAPYTADKTGPGWLNQLHNQAEFDSLARVYDAGTPLALPHLLFAIDRGQNDAVYFINSRHFVLHEHFLKARDHIYSFGAKGLDDNYRLPQRRYLFGTLAWHTHSKAWAYEFWEGDQLTPELLTLAGRRLQETFFAPLLFKPNSVAHESLAQTLKLPVLTQSEVIAKQGFLPLNQGRAAGRLRVLAPGASLDALEPDDIVLLQEVPLALPPVAGVITTRPSTTLSHVNLLARGWGIPNAWVQDVGKWLALQGQWVALDVTRTGVTLEATTARVSTRHTATAKAWPRPDLRNGLRTLAQLRAPDRSRCGSKAANLGEMAHAWRRGVLPDAAPVPDGFCIPFAEFAAFMAQPQAQAALRLAQDTPGFATERLQRVKALATLRETLMALPVPTGLESRWQSAWQQQLGGVGVFVRSSSNSEDLPGFSGAGLYTTVPNVKQTGALAAAVKTVWASVFNAEAWEARRWHGVPHDKVVMGVFVQTAVNAQSSGVMVTLNPFDPSRPEVSYVSAKRGLGIRVVEGQRQAEQVLYNPKSDAIQVLSRSDDPVSLLLDENGGVREQAVEVQRAVLTDELVRKLVRTGEAVRRLFGTGPQDIEWATDPQGRVVLLQARPLVQSPVASRW